MIHDAADFIPENELAKYLGKVDEKSKYFRWKKKISQKDLLQNINSKLGLEASAILDLLPLKRGGSGRMLELRIDYIDDQGKEKSCKVLKDYNAREVLHPEFLYTSACISKKSFQNNKHPDFIYTGAGWGHGAGLCQIGGLGMSLAGRSVEEILYHYYPGSELEQIYG